MTQERDNGLTALQRGDYEGAIYYLERAYRADPTDFQTLLALGGAYHLAKRDPEAAQVLSEAVALNPGSAGAQYNLGICLERVNRRFEAIRAIQTALSLQPDYPLARQALKNLHHEPGHPPTHLEMQTEWLAEQHVQTQTTPRSASVIEPHPVSVYTVPDRRPRSKSRAETTLPAKHTEPVDSSPALPTAEALLRASFPAVFIVPDRRPRTKSRAGTLQPPQQQEVVLALPPGPTEVAPSEPIFEPLPALTYKVPDRRPRHKSPLQTSTELVRSPTPIDAPTTERLEPVELPPVQRDEEVQIEPRVSIWQPQAILTQAEPDTTQRADPSEAERFWQEAEQEAASDVLADSGFEQDGPSEAERLHREATLTQSLPDITDLPDLFPAKETKKRSGPFWRQLFRQTTQPDQRPSDRDAAPPISSDEMAVATPLPEPLPTQMDERSQMLLLQTPPDSAQTPVVDPKLSLESESKTSITPPEEMATAEALVATPPETTAPLSEPTIESEQAEEIEALTTEAEQTELEASEDVIDLTDLPDVGEAKVEIEASEEVATVMDSVQEATRQEPVAAPVSLLLLTALKETPQEREARPAEAVAETPDETRQPKTQKKTRRGDRLPIPSEAVSTETERGKEAQNASIAIAAKQIDDPFDQPSTDTGATPRPTRRKATPAAASGPVVAVGYTDYTLENQESRPYHPSAVLALKWAIGSLLLSPLLIGIILAIVAISKALEVRRWIALSDRWGGRNLVNAAIVLSCIGIPISALAFVKLLDYTGHLR